MSFIHKAVTNAPEIFLLLSIALAPSLGRVRLYGTLRLVRPLAL